MSTVRNKIFPSATNVIRHDHTQVISTFHQYEMDSDPNTKEALVCSACLALEIHAQLEDEIFYPAMRAVSSSDAALDKSASDHESMRQLIARLRDMQPTDPSYDQTFMDLMKTVMHHVAEEETVLLPEAELKLKDSLGEMGGRMVRRRIELSAPHAGEIAVNTLRSRPGKSMLLAAGALVAGTYVLRRSMGRQTLL